MNIFVLDSNPALAARTQHDRHVVKMILESCQMLSTAVKHEDCERLQFLLNEADRETLYKPTHANHPCSIWVRESDANFVWLTIHLDSLLREYHRRFPNKTHACNRLKFAFAAISGKLAGGSFYGRDLLVSREACDLAAQHTPFVYAGPTHFYPRERSDITATQDEQVIAAYRAYYRIDKVAGNRWTRPEYKPEWLADVMTEFFPVSDSKVRLSRKPRVPTAKVIERLPPVSPSALRTPAFLRKPSN